MACSTCCSVWGKIAIANNYIAKVCCKFPCHGDSSAVKMQHWVNMPEKCSVAEASLKGELTTFSTWAALRTQQICWPAAFLCPQHRVVPDRKEGRRVRDLYCFWPLLSFCNAWEKVEEKLQNPLTEDAANSSLQGFAWSFLSFPSHQFWGITVNFPCWQTSEEQHGASVSHPTDCTQRFIFLVLLICRC